jgi:cyclophilin family peptidyl-prolyl cis-trans isomerase
MRHEIRNPANPIVTLETDHGKMVIELYHDVAPAHADSFLVRVNDGFYDGMKFHRIIKGFMIQSGNPFLVGKKDVGYYLPDERKGLPHLFGSLSMASRGHPTTAQSQFFVCLDRTAQLDKGYVVFGQVLTGFDALRALGNVEVMKNKTQGGEKSVPVADVFLTKAYQSDADGKPLE